MYEKDEYIYLFFREEAVEADARVSQEGMWCMLTLSQLRGASSWEFAGVFVKLHWG